MPLADPQKNSSALSTLLSLLPIGVAIAHDPACARITVNRAAARMLGIDEQANASLSRPELALPFKLFHAGHELAAHELPMQRAAATGEEIRDFEVELVRSDGQVLQLFEYASPLRDPSGKVIGSLGLFIDITGQKQARQRELEIQKESERRLRELNEGLEARVAERTAEARSRAEQLRRLALALADAEARERKRLAQLLHDQLQQVLSAAKLKAALARRTAPDPVRNQIEQVETLIEGAIAESRSLTIELSPPVLYDGGLNAAVDALLRNTQERRGLKFDFESDPAAEPDSEPVRVLLFEATREMLTNVVQHAQATHVHVRTCIMAPGVVSIVVQDNGKGFDARDLNSRRDRSASFGLGIMEIRERLNQIGGDLEIRSRPGDGTTVVMRAPVTLRVQGNSPPGDVVASRTATGLDATRRARVLVADDHAIFRDGLIGLLRQEDFIEVVGEAGDGELAVELARQLEPDILIVDVTMPRLNGLQVTQILSREQPALRIVGLSMHDRADMAMAMRRAGAAAYLTKDGASETLIAVLRSLAQKTEPPARDQ